MSRHSPRTRTIVGITDQGVWSVGNLALTLLASSKLSGGDFGAFSVAYGITLFLTGVAGSMTYEALLMADRSERTAERGPAIGFALTFGAVAGAAMAAASRLAEGSLADTLLVLGLSLPILCMIEAYRGLAGLEGSVGGLLTSDTVWTIASIAAFVMVDDAGPGMLAALWSGTGVLSLVVHAYNQRIGPIVRPAHWLRRHGRSGSSFTAEYAVSAGVAQLVPVIVGAISGLPSAGVLRLSQVAFGPFTSLTAGLRLVYTPQLRDRFQRGQSITRPAVQASLMLACTAAVWGSVVYLLGEADGTRLVGELWPQARDLVPLATIQRSAVGLSFGAIMAVRALGLVEQSRRTRLVVAASTISGVSIGSAIGGAAGAATGLAIVQSLAVTAWWRIAVRPNKKARPSVAV